MKRSPQREKLELNIQNGNASVPVRCVADDNSNNHEINKNSPLNLKKKKEFALKAA